MLRVFLFMFTCLWATTISLGHAQFFDGNKLVSDMHEFEKAERDDPRTSYGAVGSFTGYVAGVSDSISQSLCLSGKVTVRQVTTVVAKYLNEHPEQWSHPAYQLVTAAVQAAFPCRPLRQ